MQTKGLSIAFGTLDPLCALTFTLCMVPKITAHICLKILLYMVHTYHMKALE